MSKALDPKNAITLLATRRSIVLPENTALYFTKTELEAMIKKESDRAMTVSTTLDLKPLHSYKIISKQYILEYKLPKFKKFDERKGNTREHAARFLDSMAPHVSDAELCIREFSKSLTDRAYVGYLSLKLGSI